MVKVREDLAINAFGEVDIQSWAQRLVTAANLHDCDTEVLVDVATTALSAEREAIATNDNKWSERSSSFLIGLEMADILADLQLDLDALVAAVIYRSVREEKISLALIKEQYGSTVATLIDGVLRMAAIQTLRNDSDETVFGKQSAEQVDNVRKLLVAMVDDVRIALIKLAERTCAIRAVKNADETLRYKVAKEVADIYAPLAHRLGIGHIKWELEDLSFHYSKPEEYKAIAKLLDEKRLSRQSYIDDVVGVIREHIAENNIKATVYGRAKHIYSIWRKMQRKGINFSEVYDIRAIRILVPTTKDCYAVLGIIHSLWRNIPHEFDDYIAAPKENGYRSLHTAVWGPENKVLEVQIRSRAMHEEAEFGVCSHWRYKGSDDEGGDSYEKKIEWLRQVLEWHEELGVNALTDDLSHGIEQDRIYLFTPDGHIVDLPQKATPLDFAYRIHTEIGHCCRGAKVNGRIVPLNYCLKTADQVEILTAKSATPSRDWLVDSLGYLKTSKAKAKVRHWFGTQARDQNIAAGRLSLDKELKRLGLQYIDLKVLLAETKYKDLNELYMNIGAGTLSINYVIQLAQKRLAPEQSLKPHIVAKRPSDGSDIYIEGVGNLLTTIASCCRPLPGDDISGYITLNRGVSIHRQDCRNLLQLQLEEPERILQVSWGEQPSQHYEVDIVVNAYDRKGLLKDITVLLDKSQINVTALQTSLQQDEHSVSITITLEIRDFTELSRVLARINQLPNVASAQRKQVL